MRPIYLALILLLSSALSAEVYRWTDANGNTVFGDSPPENSRAKSVELPSLTIADSFFKKKGDQANANQANNNEAITNGSSEADSEEESWVDYSRFEVLFPRNGDSVRANNGQITFQMDIEPGLQAGHGIVLYLDGKQIAESSSGSITLDGLGRGEHTVFAVLHDENDDLIKNTQTVSFNLLRAGRR